MTACNCCAHPLEHLIRSVLKDARLLTSRTMVGRMTEGLEEWKRETAEAQQAIRTMSEKKRRSLTA